MVKFFKYLKFKLITFNIRNECKRLNIKSYSINSDGSVDINENVYTGIGYVYLDKVSIKFGKVTGDFFCHHQKITSLKNSPRSVTGHFCCDSNKLTSFEGLPEYIGRSLICDNNPVDEIYALNPCKEFAELLNEYQVIRNRNGNIVIETRLRQALEDSGCQDIPREFRFNNYVVM